MFQHQGIWLPDGEKHFPDWMSKNGEVVDGKGTYQIKKLRAALEHCRQFRVAVDIGAHVGLWSMQLAHRFRVTHAFEPVETFRECFKRNVSGHPDETHVLLHPFALGARPGFVGMKIPALDGGIDSGGTHVSGDGDVELRTLDSYLIDGVDFIKIDCEGYEVEVLRGAELTIRDQSPTIIVEQKPHKLGPNFGIKGTPAVDLLKSWGYVVRKELSGDYIMVPGA